MQHILRINYKCLQRIENLPIQYLLFLVIFANYTEFVWGRCLRAKTHSQPWDKSEHSSARAWAMASVRIYWFMSVSIPVLFVAQFFEKCIQSFLLRKLFPSLRSTFVDYYNYFIHPVRIHPVRKCLLGNRTNEALMY